VGAPHAGAAPLAKPETGAKVGALDTGRQGESAWCLQGLRHRERTEGNRQKRAQEAVRGIVRSGGAPLPRSTSVPIGNGSFPFPPPISGAPSRPHGPLAGAASAGDRTLAPPPAGVLR